MRIYHGSIKIIKNPIYGLGKKTNDYGLGFYCTKSLELAKEYLFKLITDKGWQGASAIVADTLPVSRIGNATVTAILTERLGWKVAQDFYNKSKNK